MISSDKIRKYILICKQIGKIISGQGSEPKEYQFAVNGYTRGGQTDLVAFHAISLNPLKTNSNKHGKEPILHFRAPEVA
jgi:hypothetical protein